MLFFISPVSDSSLVKLTVIKVIRSHSKQFLWSVTLLVLNQA